MLVRCESAKEQVIVQVSLVVSSSKSRVAATWLGGVDCDVASRQSSSSRIRLGWRHSLELAGGAAVSTSTRCDRPLHSVLGTGWEASCAKTASILVDAEGRTALLPDFFEGRKKPPINSINGETGNNNRNCARPFCDADTLADRGQRGRCRPHRLAYDSVRRAE